MSALGRGRRPTAGPAGMPYRGQGISTSPGPSTCARARDHDAVRILASFDISRYSATLSTSVERGHTYPELHNLVHPATDGLPRPACSPPRGKNQMPSRETAPWEHGWPAGLDDPGITEHPRPGTLLLWPFPPNRNETLRRVITTQEPRAQERGLPRLGSTLPDRGSFMRRPDSFMRVPCAPSGLHEQSTDVSTVRKLSQRRV